MADVTLFLDRIQQGDPHAAEELLPLVYDELRRLAAIKMAEERPGQTLQATALVHEAFLRLVPQQAAGATGDGPWRSRNDFLAAAAEAMRRILIEGARRKGRVKRGGHRVRLELLDQAVSLPEDPDLILAVDDLLTRLESEDPACARVARLHLLGGLSVEEAGAILSQSRASAYRHWKFARAWLRDALEK
jgi:RNA polymerase sigma factor (TIGR02999 family)